MNSITNTAVDRLRAGATCDNMRETLDYWSWFLTSPLTKTIMETNSLVQVPAVVRNFVLARMQGDLFCGSDRIASIYGDEHNSLDNVTTVKVYRPQEVATVLDSMAILLTASNSSMGLEMDPLGAQNVMFTALDDNHASVLALNYVEGDVSSVPILLQQLIQMYLVMPAPISPAVAFRFPRVHFVPVRQNITRNDRSSERSDFR